MLIVTSVSVLVKFWLIYLFIMACISLLCMPSNFFFIINIINFTWLGCWIFLYSYKFWALFWDAAKLLGNSLILLGLAFTTCLDQDSDQCGANYSHLWWDPSVYSIQGPRKMRFSWLVAIVSSVSNPGLTLDTVIFNLFMCTLPQSQIIFSHTGTHWSILSI